MQRLADEGLTYTQWHTTALCSPTRSCLLTGRNHHQNGYACISEAATGYPGLERGHPDGERVPRPGAARAGYNTFWIGKNHNVPSDAWAWAGRRPNGPSRVASTASTASSAARPTSGIPTSSRTTTTSTSRTSPRTATTCRRTWPTRPSRSSRDSKQSAPNKPWYMLFCPGANHAPHHAPQEYIDKYTGKFDDGYEAYREWVLPRMIERGIMPEGTELTPR